MPIDEAYHGEETLSKVRDAMLRQGVSEAGVEQLINSLQNEGILFRERAESTGVGHSTRQTQLREDLTEWWRGQAQSEIEATIPKAVEYSSTDLHDMGRDLAETMDLPVEDMTVEELTELGIYVYVLGKFSRWKGAIKDGRRVSDDTLFDIGVYIRMAQRTRAVGAWPGVGT